MKGLFDELKDAIYGDLIDDSALRIAARKDKKKGIEPYNTVFGINLYATYTRTTEDGTLVATPSQVDSSLILKAIRNTMADAVIGSIEDCMEAIIQDKEPGLEPVHEWQPRNDEVLFVLTTRSTINGAGVIGCGPLLHKIHKKIGDYYLIPSSVHEVLIAPVKHLKGIDIKDITDMVRFINLTEVLPEDRLSDRAFMYDGVLH